MNVDPNSNASSVLRQFLFKKTSQFASMVGATNFKKPNFQIFFGYNYKKYVDKYAVPWESILNLDRHYHSQTSLLRSQMRFCVNKIISLKQLGQIV